MLFLSPPPAIVSFQAGMEDGFALWLACQLLFPAHIIYALLAGCAAALRIYCKMRYKQGVRADDYWILVALLSYYAAAVAVLRGGFSSRAEL
jgi:hypothetical protein